MGYSSAQASHARFRHFPPIFVDSSADFAQARAALSANIDIAYGAGRDGLSSAVATSRSDNRLRYIDALRGVSALMVVWLHVSETYAHLDPSGERGHWLYTMATSVDFGRIGVVAFFLISGFVIPWSLRPDRPAPIATFAIKRLLRIYPAYWLSLPLGVMTTYWLWGRPFAFSDFLVNLTLLQDFFGVPAAQGLYWTLLVELVFYALCVVLLLSGSLHNLRRLCALAIVLAGLHLLAMFTRWLGTPLMSSTLAFWWLNLSIMLCGTLFRAWIIERAVTHDRVLRLGIGGLLVFYLLVYPVATTWAIGLERNAAISYALGLMLFIVGTTVLRVATRLTDWLGRISYSIYLFHPVVFQPILWWLLQQPPDSWWRTRHLGLYLLANVLLTVLLADLVYRVVEAPSIRLGHRWANARARGVVAKASRESP